MKMNIKKVIIFILICLVLVLALSNNILIKSVIAFILLAINGEKITVNDRIERSGALELIAQNGITLNNDVAARILSLQTNSDFDNNQIGRAHV